MRPDIPIRLEEKVALTPGPWTSHEYVAPRGNWYVRGANGERVISGLGLSQQNAKLIAVAPDMANFVDLIANFTEPGADLDDDVATLQSLIRSARLIQKRMRSAQ